MINIAFVDWWQGFNKEENFITNTLRELQVDFSVIDSKQRIKEVDFVFCSLMGNDFLEYDCPRILFVGENCIPDFNLYDYGIGFARMEFADRYIRYPLYAAYYRDACKKASGRTSITDDEIAAKKFCAMVVSNGDNTDGYREKLFDELSKNEKVDSGGRYRNNIGKPEGVENKNRFLNGYKFSLACENTNAPGYITEKIVEAYAAGTIPIYWGAGDVVEDFNEKAFINCNDFMSEKDVADYVIKINNDDKLYREIYEQPLWKDGWDEISELDNTFKSWLYSIVTQDKNQYFRRNRCGWTKTYENDRLTTINIYKKYGGIAHSKFKDRMISIVKILVDAKMK
ncbi:glycosyltransferase family 10 domain-containing protein [Pseudobutyrivibrio sp. UC1225]|uniref:glycosyltransferase family 10 domain-containing protein n=1 Tax=Pseudobutyrivibrio sp. UC1225 TaxID=1798185 RepID=UPI0015A6FCAE|nr:glycosyltransferase family 10 [Pseudobutyrivibrio sp. UC1225]